jgi:hypothetical protein
MTNKIDSASCNRFLIVAVLMVVFVTGVVAAAWINFGTDFLAPASHDQTRNQQIQKTSESEKTQSWLPSAQANGTEGHAGAVQPSTRENRDQGVSPRSNLVMPPLAPRTVSWCTGGELVCAVLTTDDLTEAFRTVIPLLIPKEGGAKRYKIRLSVVPTQTSGEAPSDRSAATTIPGGH